MRIKKFVLFSLIVVIFTNIIGCGLAISPENYAVKLLNEKYNDSFVIDEILSYSLIYKNYIVIAYQEDNPNLLFRAEIDTEKGTISDNYVVKLLTRDMGDEIAQNLNNLSGIYCIKVDAGHEPNFSKEAYSENSNITLKEFMEFIPGNKFAIYVNYVPDKMNPEQIYDSLNDMFNGMEPIGGKIHLYIMGEHELAKVQKYYENNDRIYSDLKDWQKQYKIGVINFENGVIVNSKNEIITMLDEYE